MVPSSGRVPTVIVTQDSPPVAWAFRRQTLIASEALLRVMREALDTYDDDLESIIIYLAVSCACVGAAMRDPDLTATMPPGPMAARYFRPVSRRAIAASTGLPRETVRRKIAAFLARGDLEPHGSGVRIPGRLLEDPRHARFATAMIREFVKTGAALSPID